MEGRYCRTAENQQKRTWTSTFCGTFYFAYLVPGSDNSCPRWLWGQRFSIKRFACSSARVWHRGVKSSPFLSCTVLAFASPILILRYCNGGGVRLSEGDLCSSWSKHYFSPFHFPPLLLPLIPYPNLLQLPYSKFPSHMPIPFFTPLPAFHFHIPPCSQPPHSIFCPSHSLPFPHSHSTFPFHVLPCLTASHFQYHSLRHFSRQNSGRQWLLWDSRGPVRRNDSRQIHVSKPGIFFFCSVQVRKIRAG